MASLSVDAFLGKVAVFSLQLPAGRGQERVCMYIKQLVATAAQHFTILNFRCDMNADCSRLFGSFLTVAGSK